MLKWIQVQYMDLGSHESELKVMSLVQTLGPVELWSLGYFGAVFSSCKLAQTTYHHQLVLEYPYFALKLHEVYLIHFYKRF